MGAAVLQTHDNLFDFFHEEVDAAAELTGSDVSEEGVFYLSNLLVEKTRTPGHDTPGTLAEFSIRAAQADRVDQRIRSYRQLGDRALYVSGFFPESLSRRTVKADYYADMGRTAYDRLSRMLRSPVGHLGGGHKGLGEIFGELAASFEVCLEILGEVHDALRARSEAEPTEAELLKLYEQWQTTGNRQALRRLQRFGLVPGGGDDVVLA